MTTAVGYGHTVVDQGDSREATGQSRSPGSGSSSGPCPGDNPPRSRVVLLGRVDPICLTAKVGLTWPA